MSLVAERAGISVRTLSNLEKGETGVSIGHVAAVIAALGMGTPFSDIVFPSGPVFPERILLHE